MFKSARAAWMTLDGDSAVRGLLVFLGACVALLYLVATLSALTGWSIGKLPARTYDAVSYSRVHQLVEQFAALDYDLDNIGRGREVPALFVRHLPMDWEGLSNGSDPADLKVTFIRLMLPLVLRENRAIEEQRRRLRAMTAAADLDAADRLWLDGLARRYLTNPGDIGELLRRVDTIPPALAIAQAAIESAWGASRFAQQGNALFGQWTSGQWAGLVPDRRLAGSDHKIRSFSSLAESVRSYMTNLNTHAAYAAMRRRRAELRSVGRDVAALDLADSLEAYSQRGREYVETVKAVIRVNDLIGLDRARLAR